MENLGKRLVCALLTAAALAAGMSALSAPQEVKVKIFSSPVYVAGREVYVKDASGNDTYYLTYNGTTYIPLRMAGNWMGKNVSWDGATRTISLFGTAAKTYRTHSISLKDKKEEWNQGTTGGGLTATLETDIKIIVDGRTRTFQNLSGQPIYPISFKNTIYLPVRNIGELLGMTVNYRPNNAASGEREAIFMRTAMTDAQIAAGDTYLKTIQNAFSYRAFKAQGVSAACLDRALLDYDGQDDEIFQLMTSSENPSREELRVLAQIGISSMDTILNTSLPDCPVLEYQHEQLVQQAQETKAACQRVLTAIDEGKSTAACQTMMLTASPRSEQPAAALLGSKMVGTVDNMGFVLYERY